MCNTVIDKLHVFKIVDTIPTENVVIVLIEMIVDEDCDGVEDGHHDVHPTLAMSSPLQGQRRLNLVDLQHFKRKMFDLG